jgi:hypothetical protein
MHFYAVPISPCPLLATEYTWLCSCCTKCRNTKREKRGSNCSCVSWSGEGDVGPYLRRQKKNATCDPFTRGMKDTRLLILIKSAVFLAHTYKNALKVYCVKKLVWEKRSNYKSIYIQNKSPVNYNILKIGEEKNLFFQVGRNLVKYTEISLVNYHVYNLITPNHALFLYSSTN